MTTKIGITTQTIHAELSCHHTHYQRTRKSMSECIGKNIIFWVHIVPIIILLLPFDEWCYHWWEAFILSQQICFYMQPIYHSALLFSAHSAQQTIIETQSYNLRTKYGVWAHHCWCREIHFIRWLFSQLPNTHTYYGCVALSIENTHYTILCIAFKNNNRRWHPICPRKSYFCSLHAHCHDQKAQSMYFYSCFVAVGFGCYTLMESTAKKKWYYCDKDAIKLEPERKWVGR